MKLLFSFIFSLVAFISFAQPSPKELEKHHKRVQKSKDKGNVVHSLDTVFNAGIPYCILFVEEKSLGSITRASVKSLAGDELIWIQFKRPDEVATANNQSSYEWTFVGSRKRAHYLPSIGRSMEGELVKFGFFKEGVYQNIAEDKFIASYPFIGSQTPVPAQQGKGYVLVERDRSGPLIVSANEVRQGGKLIGKIQKSTSAENGTVVIRISFYLPDGTLVAQAIATGAGSNDWKITTAKDNKESNLQTQPASDAKEIAQYLVDGLYL